MKMKNNDSVLVRPPKHERVSEDLLIYALSNWQCPPDGIHPRTQSSGESQLALILALSVLLALGALLLGHIA